jgi:signal transduction histidine kinase
VCYAIVSALAGAIAAAGLYAHIETSMVVLDLASMTGCVAAAGWLIFFRRQWQYAWPAALALFLAFTSGLSRLRWLGLMDIGPDQGLGPTWAAVRLIYMLLLAIIVADRTRQAEMQLQLAHRRTLEGAQRAERMLEVNVRQRTLELNRSNTQLASEIERRHEAEAGLAAALASERKALEQQRQFVSLVSHEIRTPLAVIDATAQSIGVPGVEIQPRLAKIRRAVHRLNLLVVNCLAEDRLRSGRSTTKSEAVDLRALAEGLLAHFGPLERTRIRLALPGGPAWVQGDAALLDIALHNLVQNAIKYSPPDSEVALHLHVDRGQARVDIEDRGNGVPPDEHGRIFERFFRGRGAGSASGTGLGLYLGADIARAHGGSLALVRSDARGSLFRLCLPLRLHAMEAA